MFLIVFRRNRCVAENTLRIVETSEAPPVAETASWVRGNGTIGTPARARQS